MSSGEDTQPLPPPPPLREYPSRLLPIVRGRARNSGLSSAGPRGKLMNTGEFLFFDRSVHLGESVRTFYKWNILSASVLHIFAWWLPADDASPYSFAPVLFTGMWNFGYIMLTVWNEFELCMYYSFSCSEDENGHLLFISYHNFYVTVLSSLFTLTFWFDVSYLVNYNCFRII